MRFLKVLLLLIGISFFIVACGSGDGGGGGGDSDDTTTVGVSGDWKVWHTEEGQAEEGPDYMTFTQTGNDITIADSCYSGDSPISGTINGTSISFSWTEDGVTITATGTVSGNTMSGQYSNTDGESGTWRAEKTSEPDCSVGSTYEVYGGETYLSGTDGYNPEEHGYTLLGTASSTQTFSGSYSYYIIVTRPVNIAYVDTVQGSNGAYYGTNTTGNTTDYTNVGGAPDGNSAAVGGLYNGTSGGYIVIDASGDSLSSITVYVSQS